MLSLISVKFHSGFNRIKKSLITVLICLFLSSSAVAVLSPSEAELAFNNEVLECASYYQISSHAIANMNVPQMQTVGDRLLSSSKQAVALAEQYQNKTVVSSTLSAIKNKQLSSLPNNKSLAALMGKYKVACRSLLAAPQKRLDYWIMATM